MVFAIVSYTGSYITVKNKCTGFTYTFSIGDDGSLFHDGRRFDLGDARRFVINFLASGA